MGSMNKATLCGNIGSDPRITEHRGAKCAQFTLATTEQAYTLQNGTQVPERTEWHNITAWGGLATLVERYLDKGKQVLIEGKIHYSRFMAKDNTERFFTEIVAESIVLLRGNSKEQACQQQQQQPQQQYQQQQASQQAGYDRSSIFNNDTDKVPF